MEDAQMSVKNRTAPPRSADAFAQTDTLASFDHKTFVDLLIKYPQLSWQINKHLVQIIRGLDVQMRDLGARAAPQE